MAISKKIKKQMEQGLADLLAANDGEASYIIMRNWVRIAMDTGHEHHAMYFKALLEYTMGKPVAEAEINVTHATALTMGRDAMAMLGIEEAEIFDLQDDGSYRPKTLRTIDMGEGNTLGDGNRT